MNTLVVNAVTNAQRRPLRTALPVFGEVDGRTRPALLFKDIAGDLASDLGGTDYLTRAEFELVRRAAGLSVLCAQQEAVLLTGGAVDIEGYRASADALRRVLVAVGLKRRMKPVKTLSEHLGADPG